LSHPATHAVIKNKFNFINDDVATFYIAFLKSIAIRLNEQSINLFFNEVTSI